MKIREGVLLGAVVGALGIAAGSVAAIAAVPIPDANGIIRACVKYEDINHYEQMRWITKTTCPRGEKLIFWNQKGPQGQQGIQGIQGVPGSDAPKPHVVSDSFVPTSSAGAFGASAKCPTGEHAIAGGGFDDSSLLAMSGSGPQTVSGQSAWVVFWVSRDGSSVNPGPLRVFATCIAD